MVLLPSANFFIRAGNTFNFIVNVKAYWSPDARLASTVASLGQNKIGLRGQIIQQFVNTIANTKDAVNLYGIVLDSNEVALTAVPAGLTGLFESIHVEIGFNQDSIYSTLYDGTFSTAGLIRTESIITAVK